MGISETPAQGIESGWTATAGVSHQGQLPEGLRSGTDCRSVSRRCLVSLLHTGRSGTNHPGTSGWGANRGRIYLCPESVSVKPARAGETGLFSARLLFPKDGE